MNRQEKSGQSGMPIARRTLLAGAAAAMAPIAVTGAPFFINKALGDTPLKFGLIIAKTGSNAEQGENMARGVDFYMDSVGKKVLGQPTEVVWLDEPDAQTAQQNAQKLVDEQKAVVLLGGGSSATGLAIEAVAKRVKVPYYAGFPAAREVTGSNCNRYTFRLNSTIPASCRALAPYLLSYGKKWYMLCASYAFGQDTQRTMTELLNQAGGTLLGNDMTPLGTNDFTSFMLKIRQAKPDAVVLGLPAPDVANFLKQFEQMGLAGKIPVTSPGIGDSDLWAIGPDAAVRGGIYTKVWYYNDPNNPQDEKDFVAAYSKKYGKPPADKVWQGWFSAKSVVTAIETAKSTDPGKIVTALEHLRGDSGGGMPTYIRDFDHQVIHRFLLVKIKEKIPDKYDFFDIVEQAPKDASGLETVFGSKEEVGCKMDDL